MKIEGQYEDEPQEFKASLSEMDKEIVSLAAMLNRMPKKKEAKKRRERRFRSDEPGRPFLRSFALAEYINIQNGR